MIGEFAVAKELAKQNFSIFREIGDLSKIDLIAEKDSFLIKIQVKAITEKNGVIEVDRRKNGPNYSFKYEKDMVDVFAVYIINHDEIFFISAKELCAAKSTLVFRWTKPKNNQSKKIRYWFDYIELERALRDYTPNIQTDIAVDDEIVQTTTDKNLVQETESGK